MSETLAILGTLWDLTSTALVVPLLWGVGLSVLAFVMVLVLWLLGRSRGWLEVASGRAWPRRLVLAVWLVVLVPLVGFGAVFYGAQRATLDALDETRVIPTSCGLIATSAVMVAAGEADFDADIDRVPVASIRALWTDANAKVDELKDERVQQMVSSKLDEGVTADAAALVGRWALDALQSDLVGSHAETIEELLDELEARAAPDGTVGAAEATQWLSEEYLIPAVHGFIVSLFRPYYVVPWLFVLVGIAMPLLLMAGSRRRGGKGRPGVEFAGLGAGGHPGYPGQPGQPVAGGYPGYPGQPGQPVAGGHPGYPGQPGQPVTGGYPGYPGQPGQPVAGGYPGYPGQPGQPVAGGHTDHAGQPAQAHPGQPPTWPQA